MQCNAECTGAVVLRQFFPFSVNNGKHSHTRFMLHAQPFSELYARRALKIESLYTHNSLYLYGTFNLNAIDLSIWSILCANNSQIEKYCTHAHDEKCTVCSVRARMVYAINCRRNKETRCFFRIPFKICLYTSISLEFFLLFCLHSVCVNQKKAPYRGTNDLLIQWTCRKIDCIKTSCTFQFARCMHAYRICINRDIVYRIQQIS